MNGRDLALGGLGALAVAGLAARRDSFGALGQRGSREVATPQVPLLRHANGRPIRVYHGTPWPDFEHFSVAPDRRNTANESAGLGIWFTTDARVASSFAVRVQREYYETGERWEDGKPKQYARYVQRVGGVFPVYLRLKSPKIYTPGTRTIPMTPYAVFADGRWGTRTPVEQVPDDAFEQMMDDRDAFAEYIDRPRGRVERGHWRDRMMALHSEVTNAAFVAHLRTQGHDGIWLKQSVYDGIPTKHTYNRATPHDTFVVFDANPIVSAVGRGRRPGIASGA